MKLGSAGIALALLVASCGKSQDIGDGFDEPGARGGEAGGAEPGMTGGEGGGSTSETTGGSSPGETSGGSVGSAGESTGGSGGSSVATGGTFGGIPIGGDKGTRYCSLPIDFELVEASELDSSSWISEDECDEVAAEVREMFEANVGATLMVTPLAGTWSDGSGDERIELVLDETGQGTLTFGEAAELPELDAEAAYLTDIEAHDGLAVEGQGSPSEPILGFAYGVVPESGRASEMSFRIRVSEPWSDWCAAQEPVRGLDCYSCEFQGNRLFFGGDECGDRAGCYVGQSSQPGELVNMHCGRLKLCSWVAPVCWCDAEGCIDRPDYAHAFRVTIDPVDSSVLRFNDADVPEGTRYLTREN